MQKILKELNSLKQQYQKKVTSSLKKEMVQFLNKYDQVSSIEWVQYTPYFNDGDECVFGIHGPYFYGPEKDSDDSFSYEERCLYWAIKYNEKDPKDAEFAIDASNLSSLIRGVGEDMKHVFGDHCKVVVTRSDITVTEYEHE